MKTGKSGKTCSALCFIELPIDGSFQYLKDPLCNFHPHSLNVFTERIIGLMELCVDIIYSLSTQ